MMLGHLLEKAVRAHYNISMDADGRARRVIDLFSKELSEDLTRICPEKRELYRQLYEKKFCYWLECLSRCSSVLVTGGSGYDTKRAENANRSERKRYDEFREWRDRILFKKRKPGKPRPEKKCPDLTMPLKMLKNCKGDVITMFFVTESLLVFKKGNFLMVREFTKIK